MANIKSGGSPYGLHRVIEPHGVLPQPALRVSNDFSFIYDNEILCDVDTLNVDAASFHVLWEKSHHNEKEFRTLLLKIVSDQGKLKNPWTGSGGMFVGRINQIGSQLKNKISLQSGDPIASLVSLSLTPLCIDEIISVNPERDQVHIKGQAILFESGIWAPIPPDLPKTLALAVLDVAGAAAQVARFVKPMQTVAVLGARGKSGLLCCAMARRCVGPQGKVIAVIPHEEGREDVDQAPFIDEVLIAPVDQALLLHEKIKSLTHNQLCDVVINCVSKPNCELGSIMICKERGLVYFFSMATDFTKAALGAEGIGKDVDLIIGNGYCENHAQITLDLLRSEPYIFELYKKRYA